MLDLILFRILTCRVNIPKHHHIQNADIQISAEKQKQGHAYISK